MKGLRKLGSVLCIVLAAVLVPVSVVSSWAKAQLVDETTFVETFAPLASDADVQREVAAQVIALVESQVDIDGLTSDVFDGIAELGLPDRATAALSLLEQPAAAGLRSMLGNGVTEFVESDLFVGAWESTLRVSHRALVAAATQDSTARGVITFGSGGEVELQLGPIIEEVQGSLVDSGFGLASAIPVVDASFVIAQSDALPMIALVYALAEVVGWWVPFLTVLLFVAGVLLSRRRPTALVGAGIGLALSAGTLLVVFAIGAVMMQASAYSVGVSAAALSSVFDHTISAMRASAWTLLVLGLVLAIGTYIWVKFGVTERLVKSSAGEWTRNKLPKRGNGHIEGGESAAAKVREASADTAAPADSAAPADTASDLKIEPVESEVATDSGASEVSIEKAKK